MADIANPTSVVTWPFNDFDSVFQYSDRTLWNTPDPSKQQDQFKAFGYTLGTYHETSTSGQSFSLNFTGNSVALYGATGPDFGNFSVSIDGQSSNSSAWAGERTNSTHLWHASGLAAGPWHSLTVTNGNASFLIDHVDVDIDISAPGAAVKTAVYEETAPEISYTDVWGHNKSPKFSGGGTTFTNVTGATATFKFHGSFVAAYGDSNANHGLYSVKLDDEDPVTLMSATGCGKPYSREAVCELTDPNVLYARGYLEDKDHTLTLTNLKTDGTLTFFDLDHFLVSTPDQYFTMATSGPSSTPTVTDKDGSTVPLTSTSGSSSPTGSQPPGGAAKPRRGAPWLAIPLGLLAVLVCAH